MKLIHKLDHQCALDQLAREIGAVPGKGRQRKLWLLHSELCRTAPSIRPHARMRNRTGFVGIKRDKNGGYAAYATVGGRGRYLSVFETAYEAYQARAVFLAETRDESQRS